MTIKIAKNIVQKATLCGKCFSCLQDNGKDLCKVKQYIEGKILFIECEEPMFCSYQKSFGDNKYCECPVRKAIFEKYKT